MLAYGFPFRETPRTGINRGGSPRLGYIIADALFGYALLYSGTGTGTLSARDSRSVLSDVRCLLFLSSIFRCPSACSSAPPFIYTAGSFQQRRPHLCAHGLDCQGLERFNGVLVIPVGMGLIALHATELQRCLACTSMDVYGLRLGAALDGYGSSFLFKQTMSRRLYLFLQAFIYIFIFTSIHLYFTFC
jgi:hypothetical protein